AGWLGQPARLEPTSGMHRFVWDLRLLRPKALSYESSIAAIWQVGTPLEPRGPLVLPGRYTVNLTAGGKDYSAPLVVRLGPPGDVTPAARQGPHHLLQTTESTLDAAVAAHAEIVRARAKKESLAPGVADSLSAGDGGTNGISGVAATLASLITAVGGADGAPTQGDRDAFAAYRGKLEGLLGRGGGAGGGG